MAKNTTTVASSELRGFRTAQLIRAGVLVLVGVVIAFSAPLHSDVYFDRLVLGVGLLLIGAATMNEYRSVRGSNESWWIAARAVVAFSAAGSMLAVTDSFSLALVVTTWAILTGAITVMRLVRHAQAPRVAMPSMVVSAVLAIAVLVTREDQIAVIGFFGAYAIIRGVFLAIAALDTTAISASPELAGAQETE